MDSTEDNADPNFVQNEELVLPARAEAQTGDAAAVAVLPNSAAAATDPYVNAGDKVIPVNRMFNDDAKAAKHKPKRSRGRPQRLPRQFNLSRDVLSGKGEAVKQANQHYRALLHRHCHAYGATGKDNRKKHEIARHVMQEIYDKGGRFLDSEGEEMDTSKAFKKVMKSLKDTWGATQKTENKQLVPPPQLLQSQAPFPEQQQGQTSSDTNSSENQRFEQQASDGDDWTSFHTLVSVVKYVIKGR